MTFDDLPIGTQFTTAPGGDGPHYTKVARQRAQYTVLLYQDHAMRAVSITTTVPKRALEVFPLQPESAQR